MTVYYWLYKTKILIFIAGSLEKNTSDNHQNTDNNYTTVVVVVFLKIYEIFFSEEEFKVIQSHLSLKKKN